ncbi:MAG: YicC family protein [bacterium]|nr:YicC family protein [bacterium]
MTVLSMTGFGRARGELSKRFGASIVVKCVNHKYLDVQVRIGLREELPEAEAAVRSVVAEGLARGRTTVHVSLERRQPSQSKVLVDLEAVSGVLAELQAIESTGSEVGIGDVLRVPGLVTVSSPETVLENDELAGLRQVARDALTEVQSMRRKEGAHLEKQILQELDAIQSFLDWLDPRLQEIRAGLLGRLRDRVGELIDGENRVEESRLAQEVAFLADRADVAEEVVRLRGHIDHFKSKMKKGGVVGRSLDFLCQEINRELNTLGSKSRDSGITEHLVEARTATERIREQVQNIE